MLHLLRKPAAPEFAPATAAVAPTPQGPAPVLVTEQEVLFKSAAAFSVPPEIAHRHWTGATLLTSIRHIHLRLPEPHVVYPRREASYLEGPRMSRMMEHL
ncbi:hypothetical protein A5732_07210 [Mycobacterium colombiense]|nr:hypothetical protein A5732_07210 [Mycobacterium colombiense]